MRYRLATAVVSAAALTLVIACSHATNATAPHPEAVPLRSDRAYDGAPPVIPHAVDALSRQYCLNCHLKGDAQQTDGGVATRTPHPELENCRQCHVERVVRTTFRENSFEGRVYVIGERQQDLAPWRIPHPLTMRENCTVCHTSVAMHPELRTTHPERENCRQCHVPANEGWPGPRPHYDPIFR